MIQSRKIGIALLYNWHDGPSMHFRLSELKEDSVAWLIEFLNSLHGQATITEPAFIFPESEAI